MTWSWRIPFMHTLARPLVRQASRQRQSGERAFTLIELLTVIAIIAILASISFGVISGVKQRSMAAQAKTELAVLSQALEAYKKQYGDYPQTAQSSNSRTARSADLYAALNGRRGPTGASITDGKRFIDVGKFSVENVSHAPAVGDDYDTEGSYIVDPWGNAYKYLYKDSANWRVVSYVLYSSGPDGVPDEGPGEELSGIADTGHVDLTVEDCRDNIYANK